MTDPVPNPVSTPSPVDVQGDPVPPSPPSGDGVANHPVPRPRPGGDLNTMNNPGSTWLITERTAPAWTALLHHFNDNQWHDQTQFERIMRTALETQP